MAPATGLIWTLIVDLALALQLMPGKHRSLCGVCEKGALKTSSGNDVRFVFLSACG